MPPPARSAVDVPPKLHPARPPSSPSDEELSPPWPVPPPVPPRRGPRRSPERPRRLHRGRDRQADAHRPARPRGDGPRPAPNETPSRERIMVITRMLPQRVAFVDRRERRRGGPRGHRFLRRAVIGASSRVLSLTPRPRPVATAGNEARPGRAMTVSPPWFVGGASTTPPPCLGPRPAATGRDGGPRYDGSFRRIRDQVGASSASAPPPRRLSTGGGSIASVRGMTTVAPAPEGIHFRHGGRRSARRA